MFRKKLIFASLLLFLAICVLAWEFWPSTVNQEAFSYNPSISMNPISDCVIKSGILDQYWKISYPHSMNLGEGATIRLSGESGNYLPDENDEESCELTIAARMEVAHADIKPGNTIFLLYDRNSPMNFEWQLYPTARDLEGKIWIKIIGSTQDEPAQDVPLFVIPFTIRTYSILGTRPVFFRLFFAALIFLAAIYLIVSGLEKSE